MTIKNLSTNNLNNVSYANNSNKKDRHVDLTRASNQDLYNIAVQDTQKKHKNDFSKFMGGFLCADVLSKSILKEGALSDKILAGANAAKSFGNFLAAIFIMGGAEKVLLGNNEKFQNFKNNNPIMTFFADILVFFGLAKCLEVSENKFVNLKSVKPKIDSIKSTFKNLGKKIDASSVSKFIMDKGARIAEFGNKVPFIGKTGKFLIANAPWLVFFGMINNEFKKTREVEESYQTLKDIRQNQLQHRV